MTDVLLHSGNLLPRVLLPDPGGSAVDLSHQSIAGNPIILWSIADLAALSDADRLVALGLVAGGLNTAIVAAVNGLDPVPVSLIAQAVSLPFLFGLLSQMILFRRALR
jgi:hypothetical protein